MQYFKGDDTEKKYDLAGAEMLSPIQVSLNDFFNDAYNCYVLGDIIWDSKRSPLANAISKEIFREAFPEIYETFLESGSFEGYISVFKKIFGDTSSVEFTVPAPGKLIIDIHAEELILSNLVARYVENNQYFFDEIMTRDGDNIATRTIKGMDSQYEVEQMLFELVPSGIYTEINLTVGA